MGRFSLVTAVCHAKAKPKVQHTAQEDHLILVRLTERMKEVSRVMHSRPAGDTAAWYLRRAPQPYQISVVETLHS